MTFGIIVKSSQAVEQITSTFPQMYLWAQGGTTVSASGTFDPTTWTKATFPVIPSGYSGSATVFLRNINSGTYAIAKSVTSDGVRLRVLNSTGSAVSRFVEWKVYVPAAAFSGTPLPAYGMVTYNENGVIMSRSDLEPWKIKGVVTFTKSEILSATPVFKNFGYSSPYLNASATGFNIEQTSVANPNYINGMEARIRFTGVQTSGNNATVFAATSSTMKVFENYSIPFTSISAVGD